MSATYNQNDERHRDQVRELYRDAAARPVDWRWQRARLAREDPRAARLLRRDADDWFRMAKRYQEKEARCHDLYDYLGLDSKWRNISEAVRLKNGSNRMLRIELEARLLAGESMERINERIHVRPPVATWYERLFFHVRDRLHNRGWVSQIVLGETLHAGANERDHELLWRLYGYVGGSHVLDAVADKQIVLVKPETADGVKAFAKDETENNALLKSMFASRLMPVNSFTSQAILEIHQGFLNIKNQAEGGGESITNIISVNIQAMLENVPWVVGTKPIMVSSKDPEILVGRLPPPLIEADALAAELRPEELYLAGMGEEPRRLEQMREIKFPPPPERGGDGDFDAKNE